jgi:hypothetical protein
VLRASHIALRTQGLEDTLANGLASLVQKALRGWCPTVFIPYGFRVVKHNKAEHWNLIQDFLLFGGA